jgi:hypothetical protein
VPSQWGITPRQSIELECARRGEPAVVDGCLRLLAGQPADDGLVFALGGPAARAVLDGGQPYWLRVWAMRGLLYAWADESWRVRELAAKVIARRGLGDALTGLAALGDDPVARVRAAAGRAVAVLTATRA